MTDHLIVEAPVRLDFAGGWTDVPPFVDRQGGLVVNAAIDTYVRVEVTRRPSGIVLVSEDLGQSIEVTDPEQLSVDGDLPLLQAAVRRFLPDGGVEIRTSSGTPLGSGLGTSGALGTALAFACSRIAGLDVTPHEAAHLGWLLEVEDCGLAGGRQDQFAAALGGFHVLSFDGSSVDATPIEVPADVRLRLEEHLVLCYVGESRVSGATIVRVMQAYEDGVERVVRALEEMKEIARRLAGTLHEGDLELVGQLLHRNWECQKMLDDGMQTTAMKVVEEAVEEAGSLGGKAAGSGAGGCLFFVAGGDPQAVRRAVINAGAQVLPMHFTSTGVREC
jgi:D-glycero-alpha-D-manno-heptose-7-phosphate kinase